MADETHRLIYADTAHYMLLEGYDIRDVPTAADVQPVKRGRWIKQEGFWNKNTVKCSLCGNYLDMNGVNGGRSDANYCPNCGARMEGGIDG